MKILVCGGRDFGHGEEETNFMNNTLDEIDMKHGVLHVVHGNAHGADYVAKKWARDAGAEEHAHPANWERYGRSAGPRRNAKMLSEHTDIDMVVAFPGGDGTADMVKKALVKGIKVYTPVMKGRE
jgi:hypothetical protein